MKFASTIIAGLLLAEKTSAFVPQSIVNTQQSRTHSNSQSSSFLNMAMDMPQAEPAETTTVAPAIIQQNAYGQPSEVRYSDFLKLVKADKVEKVTFSADGTQLLGVDVDGARIRIEALPNDPDLLTELTSHKVRFVLHVTVVRGWLGHTSAATGPFNSPCRYC